MRYRGSEGILGVCGGLSRNFKVFSADFKVVIYISAFGGFRGTHVRYRGSRRFQEFQRYRGL